MPRWSRAGVLLILAATAAAPVAARPPQPYTVDPAPYRATPRFAVSYVGTGRYHTTFHATPPNPGGAPDTNDANDSSEQSWSLRFRDIVEVPDRIVALRGARGATRITARIRHKHVDGLYRQLDKRASCTLRASTSRKTVVDAELSLRYDEATATIRVTAKNPVSSVLDLLPRSCPKQGESIDRILDTYATPGFSFDPAYGADRWFTSQTIAIPVEVFHRAAAIRIPVSLTRANTPPKRCAVRNPRYERCTTGGSWRGTVTLRVLD